jgi:hypothetical protein
MRDSVRNLEALLSPDAPAGSADPVDRTVIRLGEPAVAGDPAPPAPARRKRGSGRGGPAVPGSNGHGSDGSHANGNATHREFFN